MQSKNSSQFHNQSYEANEVHSDATQDNDMDMEQEPEIVKEIEHEDPWSVRSNVDKLPEMFPRQIQPQEIFQMDDDDPILNLLPDTVRDAVLEIKATHNNIAKMQAKLTQNLQQFTEQ